MDNIYRSLTINNNTSERLIPARLNITYNEPILENPLDYKMAVVNFSLPLQTLPLFICPIVPNQGNPNLTTLVCGVAQAIDPSDHNPQDTPGYPTSLLYVPQSLKSPMSVPVQNQPTQIITPYYYIHSYQQLVTMLNTALQTSFTAAGEPGGAGLYPYFFYDESSKLFKIAMPWEFVTSTAGSASNGWTVFFDKDINRYLNSFNVVNNADRFDISLDGLSYNNNFIGTSPFTVNSPVQTRGAGSTYIISQEYRTFDYLNNTRKIVIKSNTLPVRKEYLPQSGTVNSPVQNSIGIITDYNLFSDSTPGANKSIAMYNAEGMYRFIDFTSDTPIHTLDLEFFWSDEFNRLTPIYLDQFNIITMKIGFFSKNFYSSESKITL